MIGGQIFLRDRCFFCLFFLRGNRLFLLFLYRPFFRRSFFCSLLCFFLSFRAALRLAQFVGILEQNIPLFVLIDDVQDRYYGGSLDLDDLELVSAAGIPDTAVLRNHMDSDKKDIKE